MSEWVTVTGKVTIPVEKRFSVKKHVEAETQRGTTLDFIYDEVVTVEGSVRVHEFRYSVISCRHTLDGMLKVLRGIPGCPEAVEIEGTIRV